MKKRRRMTEEERELERLKLFGPRERIERRSTIFPENRESSSEISGDRRRQNPARAGRRQP